MCDVVAGFLRAIAEPGPDRQALLGCVVVATVVVGAWTLAYLLERRTP